MKSHNKTHTWLSGSGHVASFIEEQQNSFYRCTSHRTKLTCCGFCFSHFCSFTAVCVCVSRFCSGIIRFCRRALSRDKRKHYIFAGTCVLFFLLSVHRRRRPQDTATATIAFIAFNYFLRRAFIASEETLGQNYRYKFWQNSLWPLFICHIFSSLLVLLLLLQSILLRNIFFSFSAVAACRTGLKFPFQLQNRKLLREKQSSCVGRCVPGWSEKGWRRNRNIVSVVAASGWWFWCVENTVQPSASDRHGTWKPFMFGNLLSSSCAFCVWLCPFFLFLCRTTMIIARQE